MIEVKNVHKSFGRGASVVTVLNDVSLTVGQGEWVSIMGPSGSGKSTFLRSMAGLERPDHGQVLFQAKEIYTLPDDERADFRRHHIGFVFQDFRLLPYYSVIDNVMLPLTHDEAAQKLRPRAKMLLERVGITANVWQRLPHTLSGGEKQRVAIARALMAHPAALFCDEPSGNLDSENRDHLLLLLTELRQEGQTLVVVTHDPVVAARGNSSYRLEGGRLQPEGVAMNG